MATFATIAKRLEIDINKELQKIFSNKLVVDFIVRSIWSDIYLSGKVGKKQVRLETDTARSESYSPGPYSSFTQGLKQAKNQKYSNVTLQDTSELRLSTKVKALPTFATITADFEKENGSVYGNFQDLFSSKKEFEDAVLTLSPARYQELIDKYIKNGFKEIIIKKITTI